MEKQTKFYETVAKKVDLSTPVNTINKTWEQIFELMGAHWNEDTKGNPKNKITAYAKAVSKTIFDPENWKNPCYAKFPDCGKEWAKAVIAWYHGCNAIESGAGVYSLGYQC